MDISMSILKKGLSIILAVSMMAGLTACKRDKFTNDDFIKAAQELGLEEYDDRDDLYDHFSTGNTEKDGYFIGTDDDAIDFYDDMINRFDSYSDAKPTEFSVVLTGEEGKDYFYFITFKNETKAQKFFDEYSSEMSDAEAIGKTGIEYSYSSAKTNSGGVNTHCIYHKEDKVMVIISLSKSQYEDDFVNDFCKALELPSPIED